MHEIFLQLPAKLNRCKSFEKGEKIRQIKVNQSKSQTDYVASFCYLIDYDNLYQNMLPK